MKRFCCGIPTNPAHLFPIQATTPDAPVLASVTDAFGPEAGGKMVVLRGTGFLDASAPKFGGIDSPFYAIIDDTRIDARTPAGTGMVDVTVTTPYGSDTLAGGFAFSGLVPCTVIAIVPSSGLTTGGTHVVIEVDDSTSAISAAVNGVDLLSFAIDDATHVSGDTVGDAAGAYDVTVTNSAGVSAPLAGAYTYVVPFDATTLPWSAYQKSAGYAAMPQLGTASAGASGGKKLIHVSGTDPVVGETLNGIAGIRYGREPLTSRFQTTGGADVTLDDLVSNTDYTVSILACFRTAGRHSATLYENSTFLGGDAHYNFGISCDAAFAGTQALTFDAATNTIARSSGDFTAEGFANGQPLRAYGTAANDGDFGGNTISSVTATVITLTGGVASEVTSASDYGVCLTSGGKVDVMHFTGGFAALTTPPPITMDLHWIFIRHTGGMTQVDIDGVPGTPQAHTSHAGLANQLATRNYVAAGYVTRYLNFTEWEFATAQTALSDADRDNYASYLNNTYGTAY